MERKFNKQQKLHIKSGDSVIVIAGNSKGKTGVVTKVLVEKNRAIIEGVNLHQTLALHKVQLKSVKAQFTFQT
jgi:ribosomal protein L24